MNLRSASLRTVTAVLIFGSSLDVDADVLGEHRLHASFSPIDNRKRDA